jgi:hypothetical protein
MSTPRARELRRFGQRKSELLPGQYERPWDAGVAKAVEKMIVRFGVYFSEENRQYGNSILRGDRVEGLRVRLWLNDNIQGNYSVQSSYVLFEDEGDAIMCYLAFT